LGSRVNRWIKFAKKLDSNQSIFQSMTMATLKEDFDRVSSELDEALADHAVLSARIEGLVAHRAALQRALDEAAKQPVQQPRDLKSLDKTAAIIEVLGNADHPMRIQEIVDAMRAAGREDEEYNTVSIYLGNLVNNRRVERPQRGLYTLSASR
jgi:hypothetical protein